MSEPADPGFAALAALAGRIAQILQAGDDPEARAAAAATVEELRALAAQHGSGGDPAQAQAQVGPALAAFTEWLRAPTPEREARAERAMSDLQAVLGPGLGWDPARADAARRAAYRRQARAALDEIFPDKPKR